MPTEIIVSIITVAGAVVGSVIGAYASANLTKYRIGMLEEKFDKLEEKMDKHNHLVERMAVAENSLKSFHHRMDDVNSELEHIKGGT